MGYMFRTRVAWIAVVALAGLVITGSANAAQPQAPAKAFHTMSGAYDGSSCPFDQEYGRESAGLIAVQAPGE